MKITDLDLKTVKHHLVVEYDEDDTLIQHYLDGAKSYIQSYLNKSFDEFDVLPEEFTLAALQIISHWYENRSSTTESNMEILPYSFNMILDPYRIYFGG